MSDVVSPELLDPGTPADVEVTEVRALPFEDPTVGQALGPRAGDLPPLPARPRHGLVTVGDSLTHGLTSGAVFRGDRSWPALVAAGLGVAGFAAPTYGGPLDGLPLNLETLTRRLEDAVGDGLNPFETPSLLVALHRLLDGNEDYWERGAGAAPPRTDLRYENLGIYGWDLRDALSFTAGRAAAKRSRRPRDNFLGAKPDGDNDLAALSVLAPFGMAATQLGAAAWHGADGGIDTLVVALGANNALDAIVNKQVRWSDIGFDDVDLKAVKQYNVWRPTHFASEYGELVRALRIIPARRVVLATVPHVTIAPVAKGVNPEHPGEKWSPDSRYFPYYADPWLDDTTFDPAKHRHLTHRQARTIDSAIDQYNTTIADAVADARAEGNDWFLLDLCGLLDGFAARRYRDDPGTAARNRVATPPLPAPIADLDTKLFRSDKGGRRQGGLFGLDAIHPTTSGYGVVAQQLLDLLAAAGVPVTNIDFTALRADDTLNSSPPPLVDDVFDFITPLATRFISRARPDRN